MRTCLLCTAIVGLAATAGAAQSLSLTESQALAQLSAESPRVLAIRAAVDRARTDVQAAGRWPNPRATFNRESVAGVTEHMAMVAQVLPISGRRGLDIRAASMQVEAASDRAGDEIRRARADLRLAFAELVCAQAREQELTAAAARVRTLADVLARREAAGDAAGFDRVRAEVEALELDAARTGATVERLRAQAGLATFFAAPPAGDVVAVRDERRSTELPSLEALVARAASSRGEFLALQHDAVRAELSEQAARRRALPEPEVIAGTKSSNVGGGDVGSVLTLHVSLPLFDRSGPEQAAARVHAAEARARAAQFDVALRAEIAALRAGVLERRSAVQRHAETEGGGARLERIAQVSYDAGERSIFELLDAYRIAAAARLRQADLELAARQMEIELEFTSGWEIQ